MCNCNPTDQPIPTPPVLPDPVDRVGDDYAIWDTGARGLIGQHIQVVSRYGNVQITGSWLRDPIDARLLVPALLAAAAHAELVRIASQPMKRGA